MRSFFKKSFYFILPFLCWMLIEAVLPVTAFTHRHYEAVMFQTRVPANSAVYPNIHSSMDAVGDLCHHTKYAIVKHETWKTDEYGFRNDQFMEDPDILFIGDSFLEGSSLSQDELLTERVRKKLPGKKIYNMSPSGFSELDKYLKLGRIKRPKLIVFSCAERNIPDPLKRYLPEKENAAKNSLRQLLVCCGLNVFIDKALRHYSVNWIRSRLEGETGQGIQSTINPYMFFLTGAGQKYTDEDTRAAATVILEYKRYCDSLGSEFLFLPMPDKETVYYDWVPFEKQPDHLMKLDSLLSASSVESIQTLKLYTDFRHKHSALLYHLDDTHWNSTATELVSDAVVERLRKKE